MQSALRQLNILGWAMWCALIHSPPLVPPGLMLSRAAHGVVLSDLCALGWSSLLRSPSPSTSVNNPQLIFAMCFFNARTYLYCSISLFISYIIICSNCAVFLLEIPFFSSAHHYKVLHVLSGSYMCFVWLDPDNLPINPNVFRV